MRPGCHAFHLHRPCHAFTLLFFPMLGQHLAFDSMLGGSPPGATPPLPPAQRSGAASAARFEPRRSVAMHLRHPSVAFDLPAKPLAPELLHGRTASGLWALQLLPPRHAQDGGSPAHRTRPQAAGRAAQPPSAPATDTGSPPHAPPATRCPFRASMQDHTGLPAMPDAEGELVQLYVYDLSGGMAAAFSPMLLGRTVSEQAGGADHTKGWSPAACSTCRLGLAARARWDWQNGQPDEPMVPIPAD